MDGEQLLARCCKTHLVLWLPLPQSLIWTGKACTLPCPKFGQPPRKANLISDITYRKVCPQNRSRMLHKYTIQSTGRETDLPKQYFTCYRLSVKVKFPGSVRPWISCSLSRGLTLAAKYIRYNVVSWRGRAPSPKRNGSSAGPRTSILQRQILL